MNFTHNNHLKYFIGSKLFGHRENSIENYRVEVGKIDPDYYRKNSYQKELLRIADLIYSELGKDLTVFLSGGTDSEIVVRNFVDIGIKPVCQTIRFKDDYNINDVIEASEIAKELDLKLHIIDFDIKDFFYSGKATEFGKSVQCTQLAYLAVMYNVKNISTPSVMGGELLLKRDVNTDPSTWCFSFRENEDATFIRFSNLYKVPLINEWFSYTPEIMLYYLEHPSIQNLVTNKFNYKLTSVSSKNQILKQLIPAVRSKQKAHGFEKLIGFNFEAYRQLTGEQLLRLESSMDGIEYNAAINMLRGQDGNS